MNDIKLYKVKDENLTKHLAWLQRNGYDVWSVTGEGNFYNVIANKKNSVIRYDILFGEDLEVRENG